MLEIFPNKLWAKPPLKVLMVNDPLSSFKSEDCAQPSEREWHKSPRFWHKFPVCHRNYTGATMDCWWTGRTGRSPTSWLFIEKPSLSFLARSTTNFNNRPLWDIRTLPTFQQISARPTRASGAAAWLLQRRNPWYPQQWDYVFDYNVLYLLGKFNNVIKMREFLIKLSEIDSDWPSLLGESFVFN